MVQNRSEQNSPKTNPPGKNSPGQNSPRQNPPMTKSDEGTNGQISITCIKLNPQYQNF